jgi:hypothetical protein
MFIKKVSRFWSHFWRVWLQSLEKYLYDLKIFFLIKKISKNAEFHADFKSVEKVLKKFSLKKLLAKM